MIIKTCKECKKEFRINNCRDNTAKFCSIKCRGLAHKGINNINFGKHRDLNIIEKIRNSRIIKGLNLSENNPMFGKHHNKETKIKISKKHKGKTISEKQRKERSILMSGTKNPMFGKHHNEETKKLWSIQRKGKIISEAQRQKQRDAAKNNPNYGTRGKNLSEFTKEKIKNTRILRGLNSPEKNPNWQGGKSFEKYGFDFNDSLKSRIRQRDDHTCNICLVKDAFSNFPVHHINYNKKDNIEKNLITLCNICHLKTNFNRDNWRLWFSGLMFEKFKNNNQSINNERRAQ